MSETVIEVENLSKKYIISHQKTSEYGSLREKITDGFKSIGNSFKQKSEIPSKEEFWALKDISFEVKQGDRIGIIGRNGAGKSTLLKILSRITEPTAGQISIKGRVASLLEVGTGFHPELTGRENIFLNGAILGMSRTEIIRKFDEIVDFAEVEKFLDTPVKRYSSGMYVRLAFAVAAHLEPEILIVDEVLAVGDSQFQKKCLSKMKNVASEGRTIIFVSHQMAAISNLCSSCMLFQNGNLAFQGKTKDAIEKYLDTDILNNGVLDEGLDSFRPTWAEALITSVRILNNDHKEQTSFPLGSDLVFEMTFKAQKLGGLKSPVMGIIINHTAFGIIGGVNTRMTGFEVNKDIYTDGVMRCKLKNVPFLQGNYTVDFWLGDGFDDLDTLTSCLSFSMENADIYKSGRSPFSHIGIIFLDPEWQLAQ